MMVMVNFDVKLYEELGWKASQRGFFNKWQQLSSSIKEVEEIPLCQAGYKAYKQLKMQGSA